MSKLTTMPRLSVDLSEETHSALKLSALRAKRPAADIVRGLIEAYLEPPSRLPGLSPAEQAVVGADPDWDWRTTIKLPPAKGRRMPKGPELYVPTEPGVTVTKPAQKVPNLSKAAQVKGKMGR